MSDEEPQPRTSLARRIVANPLSLIVIGFGGFVLVGVATSAALRTASDVFDLPRNSPPRFLAAVAAAAIFVAAYKGYKRWIEQAPDRELPIAGAGRELALGLGLGFALFSVITGLVAWLGGIEVIGVRGIGALWSMLAMAVFSSVSEEILLRGIVFRHLETLLGSWSALALSAALFGALHLANPDSTPFAAFAIGMEAGILLAAAYMLTRRLWLPIGIHAAWNFTQGWVFSVPVSGGDAPLGLLVTRLRGPDWLTGGAFGLEASVVALVVATLAGLALLYRAVSQGRVVAPIWQRSREISEQRVREVQV